MSHEGASTTVMDAKILAVAIKIRELREGLLILCKDLDNGAKCGSEHVFHDLEDEMLQTATDLISAQDKINYAKAQAKSRVAGKRARS